MWRVKDSGCSNRSHICPRPRIHLPNWCWISNANKPAPRSLWIHYCRCLLFPAGYLVTLTCAGGEINWSSASWSVAFMSTCRGKLFLDSSESGPAPRGQICTSWLTEFFMCSRFPYRGNLVSSNKQVHFFITVTQSLISQHVFTTGSSERTVHPVGVVLTNSKPEMTVENGFGIHFMWLLIDYFVSLSLGLEGVEWYIKSTCVGGCDKKWKTTLLLVLWWTNYSTAVWGESQWGAICAKQSLAVKVNPLLFAVHLYSKIGILITCPKLHWGKLKMKAISSYSDWIFSHGDGRNDNKIWTFSFRNEHLEESSFWSGILTGQEEIAL